MILLCFECFLSSFLDGCPDGAVYIVMCFLVRTVEAVGAAALSTASFAILANTFPDNVATVFVSLVEYIDLNHTQTNDHLA